MQERGIELKYWNGAAIILAIYDMLAVNLAYFIGLWLRFDLKISNIEPNYIFAWARFVPIYTLICFVIFYTFKLYRSIWKFASYSELKYVIYASFITGVLHAVLITILFSSMPVSYYVMGIIIQFLLIIGSRFSYRFMLLLRSGRENLKRSSDLSRVMIVGAGNAGRSLLRDIKRIKDCQDSVVCFIDDDRDKWGRRVDDIPVVGGRRRIFTAIKEHKIDKIYVAMPGASSEELSKVLNICKETGCVLKNLPSIYQLANGEVQLEDLRDVNIEDLLGRPAIKVDLEEIFDYLNNKVIMVTGGGGSIGGELCRQIAAHAPKQLIIFDIYENNAYEIEQELLAKYPELNLVTIIGSVRDLKKLEQVFGTYKPDVVYHAAAHKHVPLMEDSPCEAIKNNTFGTYNTALAAIRHNCKRFVLISTDKAVNPTNVMGASKRMCEMVIQTFARKIKAGKYNELCDIQSQKNRRIIEVDNYFNSGNYPKTEFAAVRFGNVLGSNGSVIPKFKKQIDAGGPVTVTHPDIIRYFMTISEAVSLVLQAGNYAKGGEIFVLDMGTPIKIDNMARNLIKLLGYRPDVDIKIEYTGLRPGEKLFEERLMSEEGMETTPNRLINIGKPIDFDEDDFIKQLKALYPYAERNSEDIRKYIKKIVTTYHSPLVEDINEELFHSMEKEAENKKCVKETLPQAASYYIGTAWKDKNLTRSIF